VSATNVTLRAGHDSTVRAKLITRLSASWSSITGHQSHQIFLALNEVDPSSSMEAGMICRVSARSPCGRASTIANSKSYPGVGNRRASRSRLDIQARKPCHDAHTAGTKKWTAATGG
jgi:hypothetical protein